MFFCAFYFLSPDGASVLQLVVGVTFVALVCATGSRQKAYS